MKNKHLISLSKWNFDAKVVLAESSAFFRANRLLRLARAMPKEPRFTNENIQKIVAALSGDFGGVRFDRSIIFPSMYVQSHVSIGRFKKNLADRPLRGLPEAEQYAPSVMQDGVEKTKWSTDDADLRRTSYLWMYSSAPMPQETKLLNFPQEQKLFETKGWNGKSLAEHYVAQRVECARRRNRSFDAWNEDSGQSQESWCLASLCYDDDRWPSGCVWVGSYMYTDGRLRVKAAWGYSANSFSIDCGAHPVIVVPMEDD